RGAASACARSRPHPPRARAGRPETGSWRAGRSSARRSPNERIYTTIEALNILLGWVAGRPARHGGRDAREDRPRQGNDEGRVQGEAAYPRVGALRPRAPGEGGEDP